MILIEYSTLDEMALSSQLVGTYQYGTGIVTAYCNEQHCIQKNHLTTNKVESPCSGEKGVSMNKILIPLNNVVLSTLELMINYLPPTIHNMSVPTTITNSLITLYEKLEIMINKGSVEKEVEHGRA